MRVNGWGGKGYSAGRYWSVHLWPSVEFTWIVGNRSFHVEAKWLLWEAKVNTFWGKREDPSEPCECDVEDRHAL